MRSVVGLVVGVVLLSALLVLEKLTDSSVAAFTLLGLVLLLLLARHEGVFRRRPH